MKRRYAGFAIVLVLAAIAVSVWALRFRHPDGPRKPAAPAAPAPSTAAAPAAAGAAAAPAPGGPAPQWTWDADPQGPLRLDGQVVDDHGDPVGDALVVISTVPPATTRTQQDGSFHFEKLVGRTFTVRARAGALVGLASYKLTSSSDPLVLRLRPGATLAVHVHDEADQPIAGAVVALEGEDELSAITDARGKAQLIGVASGMSRVTAVARGYAKAGGLALVGDSGEPASAAAGSAAAARSAATTEVTILLRRGFAVSGKVVDEGGQPIARALVRTDRGGAAWLTQGSLITARSNERGEFELAALPPGTFVLTASDGEHAEGLSKPVTITDQPVREVLVTMKAGGAVSGVVVTRDGAEVPYAAVRITLATSDAADNLAQAFGAARQVASDDHGRFAIKGLARARLQLRAEGEAAASALVEVSLIEAARRDELRVVLDVDGSIAGTVTDEHGEPVTEVAVHAFPDLLGGASVASLALAGMSSTTSDGSGAFVIRGLPEGAYRVWASRSGASEGWGKNSAAAKVGDHHVRLTLAAPGRLVGKILSASDQRPPSFASVTVSGRMPVTTRNGEFSVAELEPGSYDLTVRGPEFATATVRNLKVSAGQQTDAGTILVMRGRRLVGRVVDQARHPVPGARVRVGELLVSEGSSRGGDRNLEQAQGIRSATTDAQGGFVIIGLPAAKVVSAIAEHPSLGRSVPQEISAGSDDPPAILLQLRRFGSLAGVITVKGKPTGELAVSVTPKGGGMNGVFVTTAADGSYGIEQVPEGPQVVMVMRPGGMSMTSTSAQVEILAGKRAKLDIDVKGGELTLATVIKAKAGQQVDAAQVFLFSGTVNVTTGKQLMDQFTQGSLGMQFWLGASAPAPRFFEQSPGAFSVCSIPITGNLMDGQFMQRIQEHLQTLAVYCQPVTLTPSPTTQTISLELPAMTPLPEPPAPSK